ncbi:MAG: signal peptidase II [Planctomycetales bacterium]|nr:signal peptidase II [Planctomycetales bacterium]
MSTTPGCSSRRVAWVRWSTFLLLSTSGTAIDLLTKQWIFSWRGLPGINPPYWLYQPYVGIETAVNPGALFGLGEGYGSLFAALSLLAAVAIVVWLSLFRAIESWWLLIALSSVMAGVFGNLYDRLGLWNPPVDMPMWKSGVRDWILFQYNSDWVWPNFNIADSFLVCGAFMLAIHSFLMAPPASMQEEGEAIAADAK